MDLIIFIRSVMLFILVCAAHNLGMRVLIGLVDLKPDNIMVKLEDPSILERDAEDEFKNPLPQKYCKDGRVIYLARNDYGQFERPIGVIRITDFDLAVSGDIAQRGCVQAEIYRAPEVILNVGYTYSADIWSLGVMVSIHKHSFDTDRFSLTMHSFGICWKGSPSLRARSRTKFINTTIRSTSLA